jgi:hypothetical protein
MDRSPGIALTALFIAATLVPAAGRPASRPPAPPRASIPTLSSTGQVREAPPSGVITGIVIDGSTRAAVGGAVVALALAGPGPSPAGVQTRQITDEKGRFAFTEVPGDAQYTIAATKLGYLDGGFGRDTAPTDSLRTIAVKPGEWVPDIRVSIWKPGSISGVVRDEAGDPLIGVYVRAILRFLLAGRDELAAGPMTVTDDRGRYRLSGLEPGGYLVQVPSVQVSMPAGTLYRASPSSGDPNAALDIDDTARLVIGRYPLPPPATAGRAMAYGPTFYPAATSAAQAARIDLKYGDDRAGIDIALWPVAAVRVSGTVEGPAEAVRLLTLRLLPSGLENLGQGAEVATALVGADGRFTFLNVPSGSYAIDPLVRVGELVSGWSNSRMRFPAPPGYPAWSWRVDSVDIAPGMAVMSADFSAGVAVSYSGRGSVVVGSSEVNGVVVRLRPDATMHGRIVPEPDPARPEVKPPARFLVTLDPAEDRPAMDVPRGSMRSNSPPGEFTIAGIRAARYWLRVQGAPGWLVKTVDWRGRDYARERFDATMTDDFSNVVVTVTNMVPELSGFVRGRDDLEPDRTIVIAFPPDPSGWVGTGLWPDRMKASPVTAAGAFSFKTLPAGEYLVAAVDRRISATWRDPLVLTQLARAATRVTLSWGMVTKQNLTAVK